MNANNAVWLGAIFIIISIVYTGCNYFKKDNETDLKYKNYVEAKAVIDVKMPVRITRYGAKQARYNITITAASGEKVSRFNCELGGDYKVKDVITVYYDPTNADSEVKIDKP
jgi:uncharacterized membrane protein